MAVRPSAGLKALCCLMALCCGAIHLVTAAAPPLREQVSLNGSWNKGGTVPVITAGEWPRSLIVTGNNVHTYERSVDVPSAWAGKVVKLYFKAVNFRSEVSVNGTKLGGNPAPWLPIELDITSLCKAGSSFTLRVDVWGSQAAGSDLWPIGTLEKDGSYTGIIDNVWLRAYGPAHIADAFVQPSFRRKNLTVDYTLVNTALSHKTVTVEADISPSKGGSVVKSFTSEPIVLAAGERRTVSVTTPWANAELWNPETPNLYHIASRVKDGGAVIDQETRRFGFREIWIEKNYYLLNGIRTNFRGDNIAFEEIGGGSGGGPMSKSNWVESLARMKSQGYNVMRFHRYAGPEYLFEGMDELGMCTIIESALYGRDYVSKDPRLAQNTIDSWIEPWVKSWRNHTCLVMWSGSNEMASGARGTSYTFGKLSLENIIRIGQRIKQVDATRPVIFDGEGILNWETINIHYPEGYEGSPSGSIYSWASRVNANKPTGLGEFITSYGPNAAANLWWHGTWVRGCRYVNFADIRPYKASWSWGWCGSCNSPQITNLSKSWAPVALFDKTYDDLGIKTVRDGQYPSLDEGATVIRTLVAYNDEFSDEQVTINVTVRSGGKTVAQGNRVINLKLGFHADIPCTLQVPAAGGSRIEVVLQTSKGSKQKFSESIFFNVNEKGYAGNTSNQVKLGGPPPTHIAAAGERSTTCSRVVRGPQLPNSFAYDLRGRAVVPNAGVSVGRHRNLAIVIVIKGGRRAVLSATR